MRYIYTSTRAIALLMSTLLLMFLACHFVPSALAETPVVGRWSLVGLENHNVRSIVMDPINANILYAGTFDDGIFKSTDGGMTWSAINDGLPDFQGLYFSTLVIDPNNPNTLYTVPEVNHVYKSVDAGNHWVDISGGIETPTAFDLAIDPHSSNILYAGIYGSNCAGLFKSIDGGINWDRSVPTCDIYKLLADPSDSNTIYAGSNTVYKTSNGGTSWIAGNGLHDIGAVRGLAMDPINANILYASVETGWIYKSIDGALNWFILPNSPSLFSGRTLITDPVNSNTLYAGGNNISFSNDGGDTWNRMSEGLQSVGTVALYISKSNTHVLYAATSNGVYGYGLDSGPTTTPTPTQIVIPTPTPTRMPTSTPTQIPTPTSQPTVTKKPTPTPIKSGPTIKSTPTTKPTPTKRITPTPTPTFTPTPTPQITTPKISIVLPGKNEKVSANTKLRIVASVISKKKISKVEFSVNNKIVCIEKEDSFHSFFTCDWKLPKTKNIVYELKAKIYDKAGNMADDTVNVTSR